MKRHLDGRPAGPGHTKPHRTRHVADLVGNQVLPRGRSGSEELLRLQRSAGNGATVSLLEQQFAVQQSVVQQSVVQRDDDLDAGTGAGTGAGSGSEAGAVDAGAIAGAPAPVVAPLGDAGATPEHPAPVRPQMDLAGGQEVLTRAFGTIKTIVPGSIQVLDPAGFQAAYDAIYGATQYSWALYVVPTYGSLNGFANNGVNYINRGSAGLHTVVHEMLHNNTAADWRAVVGSRWDEGTTEVLTQEACALFTEPAPVCYPGESPVVREAIANGLPLADLTVAYLRGGAQQLVASWVDNNCAQNWAAVKAHMEANDWAAAKAGLARAGAIERGNDGVTPAPDGTAMG